MSTHLYAAMVENDYQAARGIGVAMIATVATVPLAGLWAVTDILIDRNNCSEAFAQARGVPAGTRVDITTNGKNAQGHPECHATGVDKAGTPVTFIWNNQNNQPPRAAGWAFGK